MNVKIVQLFIFSFISGLIFSHALFAYCTPDILTFSLLHVPVWDIIPPKDYMIYTLTFLGVCSRVTSSEKSLLTKLSVAVPQHANSFPMLHVFYSTFCWQVLIYWFIHLFLSIFSVHCKFHDNGEFVLFSDCFKGPKQYLSQVSPPKGILIRKMISCIYIIHFTFREHLLPMGICAFEGLLVKSWDIHSFSKTSFYFK